jgi:hypothetical protein
MQGQVLFDWRAGKSNVAVDQQRCSPVAWSVEGWCMDRARCIFKFLSTNVCMLCAALL